MDRCILFPRSLEAVAAIESTKIDNRYEVEVIEIDFSTLAKLRLFGFFDYPVVMGLCIANDSCVKVSASQLNTVIETALESRRKTSDYEILVFIDRFVEKAKRSEVMQCPVWIYT